MNNTPNTPNNWFCHICGVLDAADMTKTSCLPCQETSKKNWSKLTDNQKDLIKAVLNSNVIGFK
jgi:hypothetical protein